MVSDKVEAGPGPVEGQRRVLEASLSEHVVVGSRKGFSGVLGNIGKVLPEEWALFLASRIFFHILRLLCPHACVLLESFHLSAGHDASLQVCVPKSLSEDACDQKIP